MSASPKRYLTLPSLARKLGVSEPPLRTRIAAGSIEPDAVAIPGGMRGETPLFAESSLPKIRKLLFSEPAEIQL
jgi:hypothetical protein